MSLFEIIIYPLMANVLVYSIVGELCVRAVWKVDVKYTCEFVYFRKGHQYISWCYEWAEEGLLFKCHMITWHSKSKVTKKISYWKIYLFLCKGKGSQFRLKTSDETQLSASE